MTDDTTKTESDAAATAAEDQDPAAMWEQIRQERAGAKASEEDEVVSGSTSEEDHEDAAEAAKAAETKDKPEGEDEPGASDKEQPGGAAPAKDQADVWANAPTELKAAHEAALAEYKSQFKKSQDGRIAAYQRTIDDLRRQVTQPSVSRETPGGDNKAKGSGSKALESDKWKTLETEYGEIADPVKELFAEQSQELAKLQKEMAAIGTERRTAALREQADVLNTKHPDWQQTIRSHFEDFKDWLNQQPRHIREAALRNQGDIVDGEEAADVVGRFKEHLGISSAANGEGAQAKTGATERRESGTNGNPKPALSGKRQRQLETAASGKSSGPGMASGIPEDGDPEQMWKQIQAAKKRERAGL
jgi:hypothetical protein